MQSINKNKYRNAAFSILTTLGFCAAAQTATAGEYWSPSNAPITYKLANPADMTGFVNVPQYQYAPPAPAMPAPSTAIPGPASPLPGINPPQLSIPQTPTTPIPMAGQLTGPIFDPSRVDQRLYPHQRIGKTYTVAGKSYTPKHQPRYDMVGTASWYGDKFHGKLTANGEKYDKNGMTAAHKTLPLNSLVVVTNLQTGVSVTLRVNDRGPFIGERIIDLSEAAANIIGIKTTGLGDVRVQYAGPAAVNSLAAPKQFAPQVLAPQKQAMSPVMPKPVPVVPLAPPFQAPSPLLAHPDYQPLRNMGGASQAEAPKTAQLQPPQIVIPDVMNPVSIVPKAALPNIPYAIPEAYIPPQPQGGADDTVVTMTISGPIHMAGYHVQNGQIYYVPSTPYPVK